MDKWTITDTVKGEILYTVSLLHINCCLSCLEAEANINSVASSRLASVHYHTPEGHNEGCSQMCLSGEDNETTIPDQFLRDPLQCFRLYQRFKEAKDINKCKSIEKSSIFYRKEIDLSCNVLSTTDLECMSLFITSSSCTRWVRLDLSSCYIQDSSLHTIYKYLNCTCSNVTISSLVLHGNSLTKSSLSIINDIVLKCKIKALDISNNNTIGESEKLYTMLTHSMLTRLDMHKSSLSSIAARTLFAAVRDTKMLKQLWIYYNSITDHVADDIVDALTINKSLVGLGMIGNPISGETVLAMLQALKGNMTLQELWVPVSPLSSEKWIISEIKSIKAEINTKRRNQGIQGNLTVFYGGNK